MKVKAWIFLCIILLLTNTSCSNQDIVDENNTNIQKISQLENQIKDLELQINNLEEGIADYDEKLNDNQKEKDYYLDFIEKLISPMSETYLKEIAMSQWHYTIEVDGEPIPEDGIIYIYNDISSLTVSEEQSKYMALPAKIHKEGRISGNLFSNHIKFLDIRPSDTTGSEEETQSSATYTFKNLSKDSTINLEISEELQDRLGLSTNIISIMMYDDPSDLESNSTFENNEME